MSSKKKTVKKPESKKPESKKPETKKEKVESKTAMIYRLIIGQRHTDEEIYTEVGAVFGEFPKGQISGARSDMNRHKEGRFFEMRKQTGLDEIKRLVRDEKGNLIEKTKAEKSAKPPKALKAPKAPKASKEKKPEPFRAPRRKRNPLKKGTQTRTPRMGTFRKNKKRSAIYR